MEIAEAAGAYLLQLIVTVVAFIGERPWIVALGCGIMCLALVAAGKLSQANETIDRIIEEEDSK